MRATRAWRSLSGSTWVLLLLYMLRWKSVHADVDCKTNEDCKVLLVEGSECVNERCTNPFYDGGCLRRMLPGWHKVRTCNSEDPPEAAVKGFCRPSPMGYREVRIASENWEAAFFITWIMQILLGEILDVPTTVESGKPDIVMNLYHINSSFGYGTSADLNALKVGNRVGDCSTRRPPSTGNYEPCSNVISEYWQESMPEGTDGSSFTVSDLGCLASMNWYIPKFTARRDPSLVSYMGLYGEENRQKLAERFLRPTTWGDYCNYVSQDGCEMGDSVASRPPADPTEAASYFLAGDYLGHFRATEKNDCERNPLTCTGHVMDFPCTWSFSVIPLAYHLNISLESDGRDPVGGYTYTEQVQIMHAANATKSDLIFLWWKPEVVNENYMGTESEFIRVIFPPPTQTCFEHRTWGANCGGRSSRCL